ncbi:MAG: Na+/H+ antiporter NhaC family protein [Steroidobacteraceae bacterium]
MPEQFGWLSLVPPVITVALAFWLRRVIPALVVGILSACVVLVADQPLRAPVLAVDRVVATTAAPDNLRLILFSVLIGGLIAVLRQVKAFEAFAYVVERARGGVRKRLVYGCTWGLGTVLFLETWSNVLVSGTTLRTFYDRVGVSRERMAYFLHTIAISVVAMVPINSWAAFYMGLLRSQDVVRPFQFLLASIPYILYCWASLVLVSVVMSTGWTIGPLRRFENSAVAAHAAQAGPGVTTPPCERVGLRAALLVLTLVTLIVVVLLSLAATGGGDPRNGDGTAAVLYAVIASIAVLALACRLTGVLKLRTAEDALLAGCGEFAGVAALILLALTLGSLIKELGTGIYIAGLFETSLPRQVFAPLVFVIGALMSFATGTSYGTFAIMVPIALPLAAASGADPHLLFGACIAGGVFGDNTSPVSDTSIVTAAATEAQLIDHVATQLPYALVSAAIAALGFLTLGVILD